MRIEAPLPDDLADLIVLLRRRYGTGIDRPSNHSP
jgi:hypothetical protein